MIFQCIKKAALGLPLKLLLFSDFHFRHTISLVVTKQTKKLTRGTLQITVLANMEQTLHRTIMLQGNGRRGHRDRSLSPFFTILFIKSKKKIILS